MPGSLSIVVLAAVLCGPPADAARDAALAAMLERAALLEPGAPLPAGDAALFAAALSSPAFVHAEAGPLDVYVHVGDARDAEKAARKTLDAAVRGLQPAAALLAREFAREDGVLSGRRFPLLLAVGEGFRECVALLDHCDASGWKQHNAIWTADVDERIVVRTWDVQALDLGHPDAASQGKAFLEHGVGYYTIAHLAHRLLRQGSWGTVPPWLAQGLIDELDIEAYGRSWVGGESWEAYTPGWHREGWSGFVPQGSRPPPPVTGPPAELATTVKKTGDSWTDRDESGTRHWSDLAADRSSPAPASFAFMAQHESFLPRDRAYARCALDLMLFLARDAAGGAPQGDARDAGPDAAQGAARGAAPSLLELLDHEAVTPPDGMPTSEPLPVLFARALGGVPEVERLEALDTASLLAELGRDELAARIRALGAEEALALSDHREQSAWLYRRAQFDGATRRKLFDAFLEVEHWQQLREWEAVGEALDRATDAALGASRTYPKREKDQARVAQAFRGALRS